MSNILLALEITALGMGLVFGAIILLWWMMALLTSLMAEKESASNQAEDDALPPSLSPAVKDEVKAQAAAIAVSIALAEQQSSHAHPLPIPPTAIVSAWQLGMRTRQLSGKGMPNPRQLRKVG